MTKNPFLSLTTVILVVTLASCELDYAPENTYVDSKVYHNAKTAEAALAGAYVRLNVFLSGAPQDQNNYPNDGDVFVLGDFSTENLKARASSTDYVAIETSEYSNTERDGIIATIWKQGYNAIDYTNNIINGIQTYGQYDAQLQLQHIAEARFIRAYIYFQMLCIFGDQALQGNTNGDGIVLQTEPYNGYKPGQHKGRSSNADCWTFIVSELDDVIASLDDKVPAAAQRIRANKSVAKALLSRVLLYKATATDNRTELQRAASLAKEVIDNTAYSFVASSSEFTTNLFPSNEYSQANGHPDPSNRSNELIFYEPSRRFVDNYPNGMYYYSKALYYIPSEALSAYDANDIRKTQLIVHGSPSDNPGDWTSAKYLGGHYDDVIYIRLSEMKLTYAEAITRVTGSVSADAINQLNDIRQRAFPDGQKPAPYTSADFASASDFLRAVLRERRLELAYEGQYRWDLMRTDNLLGDLRLGSIAKNRWNLPVPDYEVRFTKGVISQNTGYAE
ncbi:MAG: RagB/SusD family nutrient uptake outer membrane protein [Bacteroidaceae bacterium]|nr:RagB/SusD family nutrient uptake outer membrane protein [Bacteroidaceae bacterium]